MWLTSGMDDLPANMTGYQHCDAVSSVDDQIDRKNIITIS
jgi:hypothetical protein